MTTPPITEPFDIAHWFLNRGIAVILGAFTIGGAWMWNKAEIASLRVEIVRLDTDGSRAVRGVKPTLDSLRVEITSVRADVSEIRKYLCGDRPLCSRAGGAR